MKGPVGVQVGCGTRQIRSKGDNPRRVHGTVSALAPFPSTSTPPTATRSSRDRRPWERKRKAAMNNIIYIVGLVVIVIAVLSFFGLR